MISLPPALLHPDFRRLWVSMLCSGVAMQMAAVAIGWQVYSIHHSAFDLGLIGLAEFAPVPLLALPAGQLADRLPRITVVIVWGFADAAVTGLLLLVTIHGAHQLWPFIALAAATGTLGALGNPAGRSLTPELVPTGLLTGALAMRSVAGQVSTIAGPALGGLLFALRPEAVYGTGVVLLVGSSLVLLPISRCARSPAKSRRSRGRRWEVCSLRSGPRRSTAPVSSCSSARRSSCCRSRDALGRRPSLDDRGAGAGRFALCAPARGGLRHRCRPARRLVARLAADLEMRSVAGQVSTIAGPALGGLLFALRPEAVYGTGVVLLVGSSLVLLPIS